LTIAVKVPQEDSTSNYQHTEYKTKDEIFFAVNKTLVERFQTALVAQCHQGTFFKDIGYLADESVAQQILLGMYEYPTDIDPTTRLFFEEATATNAALLPSEVATYVTVEDFQYFWQHARECTGSS
jgi:hypothetical protein